MVLYDDTTNETVEYKAFIEKFKPKKTTDDCYTPENIYATVRDYAVHEYGLQGRTIVRPFWPGADYENINYPAGCVIIDNPPFSIISKICAFYDKNKIDYFLFAPTLTLFSTNNGKSNYVVVGKSITYANGAKVNTSFVTNLGNEKIFVCPKLFSQLSDAEKESKTEKGIKRHLYQFPDNVITAAILQKLSSHGIEFSVKAEDALFIRQLDCQKCEGTAIYGAGFLIKNSAAAEKAAAEKAAAMLDPKIILELSDKERKFTEEE